MLLPGGGIVRVTIFQAAELVPFGGIANFTPYLICSVGGREVFRTAQKRSTVNPAWNQDFEFYFPDITDSSIMFDVKAAVDLRGDQDVGSIQVKIVDAIKREKGDDWYKLFK
jgi:Ca2+-dependent lipid-binding protein